MTEKTEIKLVVVGAAAVGKTMLLRRVTEGQFNDLYIPCVFGALEA